MRWFHTWQRLVAMGMHEIFLASCSFGSIHQKEFCFATMNMDADELARPCARDELKADGLKDPLSNDFALAKQWKVVDSCEWKGHSHINVLETASTVKLMRKKAKEGGDVRFTYLGGSHVSRSCLAGGRTSSVSLRPLLQQSAAISTTYGLYMAGHFAPTRMMPADHPTRDRSIPPPIPNSVVRDMSASEIITLLTLPKIRRWVSNWSRLVLLLSPQLLGFLSEPESKRAYPVSYLPDPSSFSQFNSCLGFPGEGPCLEFWVWILMALAPSGPLVGNRTWLGLLLLQGAVAGRNIPKGTSHGDIARQALRAGIELTEGRRITEATAAAGIDFLERFRSWLSGNNMVFDEIFLGNPPNLDRINQIPCDIGKWLFRQGKPYYHYAETTNAVATKRLVLRRFLQQAWDLAFMWGSYEPTEHHVGMPFQVLLATLSVILIWGWKCEAACLALAWGSLLRIGEVLQAMRKDLILLSDVSGSIDHALIWIKEPKARYRAARHQASKMEQPDLICVVQLGFGKLKMNEPLWEMSGSTLRHRLEKTLHFLGLPHRPGDSPKPLTLASLRAGGATWLITATENSDLVQRRGRWASKRVMEIYLQEVLATTFLNDLTADIRQRVLQVMEFFPEVLLNAFHFERQMIPSATWTWFFSI